MLLNNIWLGSCITYLKNPQRKIKDRFVIEKDYKRICITVPSDWRVSKERYSSYSEFESKTTGKYHSKICFIVMFLKKCTHTSSAANRHIKMILVPGNREQCLLLNVIHWLEFDGRLLLKFQDTKSLLCFLCMVLKVRIMKFVLWITSIKYWNKIIKYGYNKLKKINKIMFNSYNFKNREKESLISNIYFVYIK